MQHREARVKTPRILILRGGALGDFLLTMPALRLLRERWPGCHLCVIGNATAASLALAGGEIDEAHSQHEARWAALYGSDALPAELGVWLTSFDLVLCFWPDPERELATRFPLHPSQRFVQAGARPTSTPAARHFCEALAPLGIPLPPDFSHRLAAFRSDAATTARGPVALHPGSSSSSRNWPAAHWRALCERLISEGHRLLLITGEADTAQREALAGLECERAEGLPLPELATRLSGCSFYLGHDTGVSHLAAALGLPALILFGPSDPAIWAPQGAGIQVFRPGEGLARTTPERVFTELLTHPRFPCPRPSDSPSSAP
jgi:ADP-heptose:LPS heptosyltransferase